MAVLVTVRAPVRRLSRNVPTPVTGTGMTESSAPSIRERLSHALADDFG